jgi:hypothetical protein
MVGQDRIASFGVRGKSQISLAVAERKATERRPFRWCINRTEASIIRSRSSGTLITYRIYPFVDSDSYG